MVTGNNFIRFLFVTIFLFFISFIQDLHSQDDVSISYHFQPTYVLQTNKFHYPGELVNINIEGNYIEASPQFTFVIYKVKYPYQFIANGSGNILSESSLMYKDLITTSINLIEPVDTINTVLNGYTYRDKEKTQKELNDIISYNPKEKGVYVVKSIYRKIIAYAYFTVTDTKLFVQLFNNGLFVFNANSRNGIPYESALSFYKDKKKEFADVTKDGQYFWKFLQVDVDSMRKNNYFPFIVIGDANNSLSMSYDRIYFSIPDFYYTTYVQTNQPVYRPDSKVEIKGIVRKKNFEGLFNCPGGKASIQIEDPKNNLLYTKVLNVNDLGTFTDEFYLGKDCAIGNYNIKIRYLGIDKKELNDIHMDAGEYDRDNFTPENDNYYSYHSSGSFTVKEYKKPEYKMDINVNKEHLTMKDTLKAEISAAYFFGSPLKNTKFKYTIYRTKAYYYSWTYSQLNWWYQNYYHPKTENTFYITGKSAVLDDSGKFKISYPFEEINPPFHNWDGDYVYLIEAKIYDKSNNEVNTAKEVLITRGEHNIIADIDKSYYKTGDSIKLNIKTFNYSNEPVTAEYIISVTKTKIITEDDEKKEIKDDSYEIISSGITNPFGYSTASFYAPDKGTYIFTLTSFDKNYSPVTCTTQCVVHNKNNYESEKEKIVLISGKKTYNTGDTCSILIAAPDSNQIFLITTSTNNNFISSRLDTLVGQSKEIKIFLDESYKGNAEILVSYICKEKLIKQNITIPVFPVYKMLNVTAYFNNEIYKPQDSGFVTLKVTDNNGLPVENAEISIGIVDEGVYAIKEDNNQKLAQFFYSYMNNYNNYSFTTNSILNEYRMTWSKIESAAEHFRIGNYDTNEVAIIEGTIRDDDLKPFEYVSILIDNTYHAAETRYYSDGKFNFKLPEGNYDISFLYGRELIKGELPLSLSKFSRITLNVVADKEEVISIEKFDNGVKEVLTFADLVEKKRIKEELRKKEEQRIKEEQKKNKNKVSYNQTQEDPNKPNTWHYFKIFARTEDDEIFTLLLKDIGLDSLSSYTLVVNISDPNPQNQYIVIGDEGDPDAARFPWATLSMTVRNGLLNWTGTNKENLNQKKLDYASVFLDVVRQVKVDRDEDAGPILNDEVMVEPVLRKEFIDAMFWSPFIRTDKNGMAVVKVKFPDNLTTWRLTSKVITKDTKVADYITNTICRKNLLMRLETPRFFQQNDEVIISAIVHNYLSEDKQTKVSLKSEGIVFIGSGSHDTSLIIRSGNDVMLNWKVKVTGESGFVVLNGTSLTNEESDAVQLKIPVQPQGMKVTGSFISKMGENKTKEVLTAEIPPGSLSANTKMQINISPSIASSLIEPLGALLDYPYGCIEQTLSRFVPAVIVSNTYKKLNAPMDELTKFDLPKIVNNGIGRIYSMINYDNGWGWWNQGKSSPFMTAYTIYGLDVCSNSGYNIDKRVINRGNQFIYNELKDKKSDEYTNSFMFYVLTCSDTGRKKFKNKFLSNIETDNLTDIAKAFISMAAANINNYKLQHQLNKILLDNAINEGDTLIHWGNINKSYKWEDDNIITTSFVLKSLLQDSIICKNNKVTIEKIAAWLLSKRKGKSWSNTMQTAFAIDALTEYLSISKEFVPDYNIKIFANGNLVSENHFSKDDIFRKPLSVTMTIGQLKTGMNNIVIEKSGTGSAYITGNIEYFSNNENLHENFEGISVDREYYKLTELKKPTKEGSYKKTEFDGTLKPGDMLYVKLKIKCSKKDAQYMMIEDPIPAGCEVDETKWNSKIVDADLAISKYLDYNYRWKWWYDGREIHDNRITFFSTNPHDEKHEFYYIIRAITPGIFNVMPTKAELMYYPDINGTGEKNIIKVIE
ncbi:MAG: hypothetical protein EHM58_08975 [Ignavibacteriae bacterium]|nr:MAG: hypothetical protein EHM58_08975 [Ignavibacteriota bacterium]